MQLTPDPPFVGLATMTFLGQPKVELSCTPLFRRMPNLMDLPLISNFVQSAVDAAMAEYVAPKSLTLDLKAMLAGEWFDHTQKAARLMSPQAMISRRTHLQEVLQWSRLYVHSTSKLLTCQYH